jgi:MFS family permease
MAQFGVTSALTSIVLSTFMAGLGLGSFAAGRLSRRLQATHGRWPLRLYAAAEILIGSPAGDGGAARPPDHRPAALVQPSMSPTSAALWRGRSCLCS